ncbi:MAG: FAD-dependent oxidoreductase [Cyanobacteria bacterium P01_F01_bin.53]
MWDVAVIGAGLSGIICARQLADAGQRVCILDKSRGLGGRMATRRVQPTNGPASQSTTEPERRVDHGLRYWQPQTKGLKALTDELLAAGVLKKWAVSAYEILEREVITPLRQTGVQTETQTGQSADPVLTEAVYVATAGMSAIAKHLTQGFTFGENLFTEHRATNLSYWDDHWRIDCDDQESILARRCAIAIPAPQAADLLQTYLANTDNAQSQHSEAQHNSEMTAAIEKIKAVSYHPCLTVLAGYSEDKSQDMGELDPNGWMVTDKIGTSTDWVGLDSSKRDSLSNMANGQGQTAEAQGGKKGPIIVIHSKPAFAHQYIDAGDLQPAASVLLRASARKFREWIAQPSWFQTHRWRYARVSKAHPESAVLINPSIVCGGDWCSSTPEGTSPPDSALTDIDQAYLSGIAMAKAIHPQ